MAAVTSEPLVGSPEVDTPGDGEFVVALLSGDALLVDPATGRLPRVTGVDWPDHRHRTLGHPSAVPIAPLLRLPDGTWVFPMALREPGAGTDTCPLTDLDVLAEAPELVAAVRTAAGQWRGDLPLPDRRPDWFRPDWWDAVETWLDDRLARLGRHRTGPLRTVKFWSLSAVLEVPTSGGALYLKATCRWFRHEPSVTEVIARFAPDHAPRVLATEVSRAWMLLEPLPGHPEEPPGLQGVAAAARALAEVQLRSVGHLELLTEAGCPDRGAEATIRTFARVLRRGAEIDRLDGTERAALLELEPVLAGTVRRLDRCGLPTVLSHGDLHLGNVATDGTALVFYDWTDACLGHPFLDAAHLADSAQQETGEEGAETAWAAFLPAWREAAPDADLDLARRLAPTVDLVFQVVSYEGIVRAQESASAHELGGVQAELLRALLRTVVDPTAG